MSEKYPPPYSRDPPPPAGFVQPQYPPPPVVQTQVIPPTTVTVVPLGSNSQILVCPKCHHQIRTTVTSSANMKTHIIALILCVFLCWPCICVPYCMDSCKTQEHSCPKCKTYIGEFNK